MSSGNSSVASATLEGVRRLPPPPEEGRQVFKESSPRRSRHAGPRGRADHWLLKVPELGVRRVIAFYYPRGRTVTRKIDGRHIYGARPGIAWNFELLRRLDQFTPAPTALICEPTEPRQDGKAREVYRVPWAVVRAFGHAVLEGDTRWLVTDDIDDQLLIPWPAWAGTWTEPPPPEPDEPPVEQVSLFELPEDPSELTFKYPV